MFRSRFSIAAAAALALGLAAPLAAAAPPREDCVRLEHVRAFAAESDTSLVVRQGRSQYRRITVEAGCPIRQADRIGFAVGAQQAYLQGAGARLIAVTGATGTPRLCTASPHAYVTFIEDGRDLRARCRIQGIEGADRAAFDAAGPGRDNRY